MGVFRTKWICAVAPQEQLEQARREYEAATANIASNEADKRRAEKASQDADNTARDFVIGIATGIPLPSPGGIVGASLHTPSSASSSDSYSSSSSSSSDYSSGGGDSGGGGSSGDF